MKQLKNIQMSEEQGKRDDQVEDSNSFAVFALVCMVITIVVSLLTDWLIK
jgi:hypothetical protein